MIAEESKQKFSELGIDLDVLIEAHNSDQEVPVKIPDLYTSQGYTKDQVDTIKTNYLQENRASIFEEGKTTGLEIAAKEFRRSHNINSDSKDLNEIIKLSLESKGVSKTALQDIEALQNKLVESQKVQDELKQNHENEKFSMKKNFELLNYAIQKNPNLDLNTAQDVVNLFNSSNETTVDDNGNTVVLNKINKEIYKNDLLSPLKPDEVFNNWHDNHPLFKQTQKSGGMGGSDSSGSTTGFKNVVEFEQWASDNGKSLEWARSLNGTQYFMKNKIS